jgi:S1-C subfamily serine protease
VRRALTVVVALAAVVLAVGCVPPPASTAPRAEPAADPDEVARASVVRIRSVGPCGVAIGSGFVIDGNRLVTNRHVVEGSEQLNVETWDGRRVSIGAARQAIHTDLAVIELTGRSRRTLDPLPLARQPASPGDGLTAIGFAEAGPAVITHGQMVDTPPGRRHLGEPGTVVRMSTHLRHGNSGGPVLSDDQEVVGVAYALDPETELTLAIPMRRLRHTLDDPAALEPVRPC